MIAIVAIVSEVSLRAVRRCASTHMRRCLQVSMAGLQEPQGMFGHDNNPEICGGIAKDET